MANSILLKEAIADAKAVRETAIANAKIALEEAFTPRLQSILSQKLQQEMNEEEDEDEVNEEYGAEDTSDADSSKIDGDNKQPADDVNSSSDLAQGNPDTEVETAEVGSEEEETEVVKEGEEESEETEEVSEGEEHEEEEVEETYSEGEEEDEDELDLESIIRELEEELDDEEESEVEDIASDVVDSHEDEMHDEESEEEEAEEEVEETYSEGEDSDDEEIDLDEILREMGYGEEEEEVNEEEENNELEEAKSQLEEAMSTIKSLKGTINEVNLLNAKLLYTNKLFRSYELTNEQKHKVVETLDRTSNVREVKLVFSTLAESLKIGGTARKQKQTAKLTESFASKPVASTAPKKEVITESTNTMADRFKQLANIK